MYLAIFRMFVFVCIIFASVPAGAVSIDQAGADHLKQLFEEMIAEQQQYISVNVPPHF